MSYIKAEEFLDAFHVASARQDKEFIKTVEMVVADIPTYDVVEVVRCKDCNNCETNYPEKEPNKEPVMVLFCTRHMCGTLPDEFCSYGSERKEVKE